MRALAQILGGLLFVSLCVSGLGIVFGGRIRLSNNGIPMIDPVFASILGVTVLLAVLFLYCAVKACAAETEKQERLAVPPKLRQKTQISPR